MRTPRENDTLILDLAQRGEVWITPEGLLGSKRATYASPQGYVHLDFVFQGHRVRTTVHRALLVLHLGRPLHPGLEVDHIDCDRKHNHVSNLQEVSRLQNIRKNVTLKLNPRRESHGGAKLTEAQVDEIRAELLRDPVVSQREVGQRFGVSPAQVSAISGGKYWGRPALPPRFKGRTPKQKHGKITQSQADEIRKLQGEGLSTPEIQKRYPLSEASLSRIRHNQTWPKKENP